VSSKHRLRLQPKPSRGLIRSLNRSAVRDDKNPRVAHKHFFHEPTVCARCGAVFLRKTWRNSHVLSDTQLERRHWGFCPACQQMSQQDGQGRLLIKPRVGKRDAIQQRIHNVAERAAATQLAHELKKAFGGRVTYMWSDDGMLLAARDQDPVNTASRCKQKRLGRAVLMAEVLEHHA
jgi:hypothetical protein